MSTPTKMLLNEEARKAILKGVNLVYNASKLTLGPEGGNALMYRTFGRGPRITNDGVTISEVIEPLDEFENLAANAFKEASKRTNERVGDGTTATQVIGGKLLNEIFNKLADNSSNIRTKVAGGKTGVMQLKKEMLEASELVIKEIQKTATKITKIEELYKIANVSVEDKKLGKIIADMVWEIGLEGFIDVVEGNKLDIETEVIKGMRFPAKVPAKAFVTNEERFEMVAQDCPVVITNYSLDNTAQILAFTQYLKTTKLIIFAPNFSESVLVEMVKAWKGGFSVYPVKTASLKTDQYEDLAAYCSATFVNKDKGMKIEGVREADCGFLEKLIVKNTEAKEDATAIGGKGAKSGAVKERIETLKKQIEETKESIYKKAIERRIASMASAIGIIRVGAPSQAQGLYLTKKIEDAVYACKAALDEGYVKGGGLCLKEIAEKMPKNILTVALMAPYEQIQENADGVLTIGKDIIDPAKVVRLSVEHAVSVVAHLATVKIIIPEIRPKDMYDGGHEIAKVLNQYVTYWAKKEGLYKENLDEIRKDNDKEIEDMIASDFN